MSKRKRTEEMPYVSNYPPLDAWLERIQARCLWQYTSGAGQSYVGYVAKTGRVFVVVVYSDKMGWEVYTAGGSNKITDTLADAEHRLGLNTEETKP